MNKNQTSNSHVIYQQLTRLSAIFLILGGFLYAFIQFIHPEDTLTSVNTTLYIGVAIATSIMSLLVAMGLLGNYLFQAYKVSKWGLLGLVLSMIFWFISMIFSFNEAFILPLLTSQSSEFVKGIVGVFNSVPVDANLGIFPTLASISGLLYVFGGLIYGLASTRAKFYNSKVTLLYSVSAFATILASFVPHPFDRLFALPMGISLVLLGICMFQNLKQISLK